VSVLVLLTINVINYLHKLLYIILLYVFCIKKKFVKKHMVMFLPLFVICFSDLILLSFFFVVVVVGAGDGGTA